MLSCHTNVLIVRTWMLWPFARTGHADVLIVRTWMLWPFAHTGHTDVLIARTRMLWPFARTGHTDVLIVRTWMLWPFARTGHTDILIVRGRRVYKTQRLQVKRFGLDVITPPPTPHPPQPQNVLRARIAQDSRQHVKPYACRNVAPAACSIFVRGDRKRENVLAFCTWCKTQAWNNFPQIHLLGPWVPA